MNAASTISATVLNSSNTVVKTLLNNGVSRHRFINHSWNGTNTGGSVVADGSYTIQIVATNSSGNATRHLSAPGGEWHAGTAHHAHRRRRPVGDAGFVFTPDTAFTDTFPISQVRVTCLGTATSASGDGTWQGSGDTTNCGNGIQQLSTNVYVTDPLGVSQYWTGPTTSVTIDNGPQLTAEDSANAYFFPSGDGFSNTTTTAYSYLSVAANVTATVLNSSNTVVKTLLDNVSESEAAFYPAWDGTNTGGSVVPDGNYTVQIVATNSGGNATLDYQRHVASGTPGQLTTPTAGATLSGTAGFVFTPNTAFTDTFPISQVTVTCLGTATSASGNGTWQGSGDTTNCGNGATTLNATVEVTDPLGNTQTWTDPNAPSVTIDNGPQLTAGLGQRLLLPVR